MLTHVSDSRSNPNDQIAHAARVLGRSTRRRAVFRAIYGGKQAVKKVRDVMSRTGLTRKQVLTDGKSLANNHIVSQLQIDGETAYKKDPFYAEHRDRVLRLSESPDRLARLPTKTSPVFTLRGTTPAEFPRGLVRVHQVTIDDIDSFARVARTRLRDYTPRALDETHFKQGLQRLLREDGNFRDWGGERNDLWTTRLTFRRRRRTAVFAFKGKGTTGKLTPGKMGKNGDQIQRLFQTSADFYVVQYWREVDQSVSDLMRSLAVAKSVLEDREVWYSVIDGRDSQRLITAYPKAFPSRMTSINERRNHPRKRIAR